jgi:hypothetical protein
MRLGFIEQHGRVREKTGCSTTPRHSPEDVQCGSIHHQATGPRSINSAEPRANRLLRAGAGDLTVSVSAESARPTLRHRLRYSWDGHHGIQQRRSQVTQSSESPQSRESLLLSDICGTPGHCDCPRADRSRAPRSGPGKGLQRGAPPMSGHLIASIYTHHRGTESGPLRHPASERIYSRSAAPRVSTC